MKLVTILLLIGIWANVAYGDDSQYIVDGGIGVFHSATNSLSETKMLTLGIQNTISGPWKDRTVVGGWIDNAGGGKTGSALASGQIGFEVNKDGLLAGVFSGPAAISTTDVLLGGHLQFMDDVHLGIEDKDKNYFGVMYRHLSSAGISTPNIGRDVIAIELRF